MKRKINMVKLSQTEIDREYRVTCLNAQGTLRRRLRDLGIVEGAIIERLRPSPLGDPVAYLIKGTQLAIRNSDACLIEVEYTDGTD